MNHYSKAIDIVTMSNVDFRAVCIEVAKISPSVLAKAAYQAGFGDPWKAECKALVEAGEKIQAIKLWRTMTGSSLKDAKESVEALWHTV